MCQERSRSMLIQTSPQVKIKNKQKNKNKINSNNIIKRTNQEINDNIKSQQTKKRTFLKIFFLNLFIYFLPPLGVYYGKLPYD